MTETTAAKKRPILVRKVREPVASLVNGSPAINVGYESHKPQQHASTSGPDGNVGHTDHAPHLDLQGAAAGRVQCELASPTLGPWRAEQVKDGAERPVTNGWSGLTKAAASVFNCDMSMEEMLEVLNKKGYRDFHHRIQKQPAVRDAVDHIFRELLVHLHARNLREIEPYD